MKSQRTKKCKKLTVIFFVVSTLCWVGVALFAIIATFCKFGNAKTVDILSEAVKDKLVAISTVAVIGIIMSMFIKDKARNTLYMISLLLISFLYGETGMYITLAIWALDEYIFYTLYKHYKLKISINKEIDLRG